MDTKHITRIFNNKFRCKIKDVLKILNDMNLYLDVYEVIKSSKASFSKNSNGIFFDMNKLDHTIAELIMKLIIKYEDSDSDTQDYYYTTNYTY